MKVLVMGASGFLGKRIIHVLAALGIDVTAADRVYIKSEEAAFIQLDVTSDASVAEAMRSLGRVDAVVHAAGVHTGDVWAVNEGGTRRLLAHFSEMNVHWVQIGSAGVYRHNRKGVINESSPLAPKTIYERSKLAADQLVLKGKGLCTIIRPTMLVGADMPGKAIRMIADSIRSRRFIFVGKRSVRLNLVHVEDVAEAVATCITSGEAKIAGRVFNLSDDLTMEEIAQTIAECIGCKPPSLRLPFAAVLPFVAVGSLLPRSPLNLRQLENLVRSVKYSADSFRHLDPTWPRHGSRKAILEFLTSERWETR